MSSSIYSFILLFRHYSANQLNYSPIVVCLVVGRVKKIRISGHRRAYVVYTIDFCVSVAESLPAQSAGVGARARSDVKYGSPGTSSDERAMARRQLCHPSPLKR